MLKKVITAEIKAKDIIEESSKRDKHSNKALEEMAKIAREKDLNELSSTSNEKEVNKESSNDSETESSSTD